AVCAWRLWATPRAAPEVASKQVFWALGRCLLRRHPGTFYATDLELVLRAWGITALTLAGVTRMSVHSTLREAVDRGFERHTVGDACAAANRASHAAMLQCISCEGRIL